MKYADHQHDGIGEFLKLLRKVRDQLKQLSKEISNAEFGNIIISSLPSESEKYSLLVEIFRGKRPDQRSNPAYLEQEIKDFEERHFLNKYDENGKVIKKEAEVFRVSRGRFGKRRGRGSHGYGRGWNRGNRSGNRYSLYSDRGIDGRVGRGRRGGGRRGVPRHKSECYKCGNIGHYARDCWTKIDSQRQRDNCQKQSSVLYSQTRNGHEELATPKPSRLGTLSSFNKPSRSQGYNEKGQRPRSWYINNGLGPKHMSGTMPIRNGLGPMHMSGTMPIILYNDSSPKLNNVLDSGSPLNIFCEKNRFIHLYEWKKQPTYI